MISEDSCNLEELVLRTCTFLLGSCTVGVLQSSQMPLYCRRQQGPLMIESEALALDLNNASAQTLALKKSCVDFVVRAVGKKWQTIDFPAEFMSLQKMM